MTKLIIARHGNTFGPNDTPTRVGGRTDLPLVESGRTQAEKLGQWLKANQLNPNITYSSKLKRTIETAKIALTQINYKQPVYPLDIFNEIDYGPDENLTEDKVIARIGEQAIQDWDEKAIVPEGWNFDLQDCINNWQNFAKQILFDAAAEGSNMSKGSQDIHDTIFKGSQTENVVLVVTSNGIARFSPHLAGNFEEFANNNKIKLSTGALGILQFEDNAWRVLDWNIRP